MGAAAFTPLVVASSSLPFADDHPLDPPYRRQEEFDNAGMKGTGFSPYIGAQQHWALAPEGLSLSQLLG